MPLFAIKLVSTRQALRGPRVPKGQGYNGMDSTRIDVRNTVEAACAHVASMRKQGRLKVPDIRSHPHAAVQALLACYRGPLHGVHLQIGMHPSCVGM